MGKVSKNIIVICAVIVVCAGTILTIGLSGDASVGRKVALVNVDNFFNNYQKTIELNQQLEEIAAKQREEREEFVEEIRQMQSALALLADENRDEKQKEIDEKIKKLQGYNKAAQQELNRQRNEYMNEILLELSEKIKTYGQENDYDYILSGPSVLYKKGEFDITDELIAELNGTTK